MTLSCSAPLLADDPAFEVDPMVVTATRLPQHLDELPAALSIVPNTALHHGRADLGTEQPLARVPGVFAQSSGNLAQDTRLQIRGFGARSGFGVREVKLLLDGMPLTFADGQSELDEVDISAIDRIEVLRGAAAALYGNASGGVVHFFTPPAEGPPRAVSRSGGGWCGLAKTHLSGSAEYGRARGFLSASFLNLGGYRDHSDAQRFTLLGTAEVDLDSATRVRVLLTGLDTFEAQDPGALTAAEVDADRRQARPGAARFDTGEDVQQGRFGTVIERQVGERSGVSAYGFAAYRDVASLLPIDPMFASPEQGGAVSVHRLAAGGGLSGSTSVSWLIPAHRISSGVDIQYQRDHRRRFANQDGMRGELGLDQCEQVRSVGPFLRYAAVLSEQWEVGAGARYDHFRFSVDDGAGGRTLDAWSPGGGIRYSPLAWLTLFGDVGTAFQVPTTTELANPNGAGFNPDLEPQTATSTEGGVRITHERIAASATGFVIDVRDVLVPYELESQPGRTFYRNASRAQRAGVELEAQAEPLSDLLATLAFAYIDARFVGNAEGGECCDDRHEPGIPSARVYGELAYQPARGLGGAVELQWTDAMFVDDANSAQSPEAFVLNLRANYRHIWSRWTLLAALGLNNIFADRYDGRVRVNAQGGRYFEPAARFNLYGTIELAWNGGERT